MCDYYHIIFDVNIYAMKNNMLIFLILTIITGLAGFAGLTYFGIAAVRILFVIFADLLIISLISKIFFPPAKELRMIKVRK